MEPKKLTNMEEAEFGGGPVGGGVGLMSTVPAGGDSSLLGVGAGTMSEEPGDGGEAVAFVDLSDKTRTSIFSFF